MGKHIFREVLSERGLLAGTTRILVTHQTQFLPLADRVLVLDGGRVLADGSFAELRRRSAASEVDLSSIASLSSDDADLDALLGLGSGHETLAGDEGADPLLENTAAGKLLKGAGGGDGRLGSARDTGDRKKDERGSRLVMDEERASATLWPGGFHVMYGIRKATNSSEILAPSWTSSG